MEVPQKERFVMENSIIIDDLGVPLFRKSAHINIYYICIYIYIYTYIYIYIL